MFQHHYQYQQSNKQNNLSFRNLATLLNDSSVSSKRPSMHAVNSSEYMEQKNSKHSRSAVRERQQNSNFYRNDSSNRGSRVKGFYDQPSSLTQFPCCNHPQKVGQYIEAISEQYYCGVCAVELASLGYQVTQIGKNTHHQSNEQSYREDFDHPSPSYQRPSFTGSTKSRKNIYHNQQNSNSNNNLHNLTVDDSFGNEWCSSSSRMTPHRNTQINSHESDSYVEKLNQQYEECQHSIEDQTKEYLDKVEQIQQIFDDIKIQDLDYLNSFKNKNKRLYEQTLRKDKQGSYPSQGDYDLFGRSLGKSSNEGPNFMTPENGVLQRLQIVLQCFHKLKNQKGSRINVLNKIPLIKSINSLDSNGGPNKSKHSSSFSNMSNKSIRGTKKGKADTIPSPSQLPMSKASQNLSSENSRVSFKSEMQKKKHSRVLRLKTDSVESSSQIQQNDSGRIKESDECQDTPESLKSKISMRGMPVPKDIAVTMFDKINVCESIDIAPIGKNMQNSKAEGKDRKGNNQRVCQYARESIQDYDERNQSFRNNIEYAQESKRFEQGVEKRLSDVSGDTGKSRKSFNRYRAYEEEN